MSLEQAILEHASALRELTAALLQTAQINALAATRTTPATGTVTAPLPLPPAAVPAPTTNDQPPAASTTEPPVPEAKPLEYKDVATPIGAFIASNPKGPEIAAKILAQFGADHLKKVDPSKYQDVLAAFRAEGMPA